MKVLMLTSEWPTDEHPEWVPFLVREVTKLKELGVEIEVFAFRGKANPANYLSARRKIRELLKSEPYDLIHAQFGQSGLLAVLPKRLPLVVTYRGSDLNGIPDGEGRQSLKGFLLQKVSQLVSLAADEVILVSERLGQHLSRRHYQVIPSGLDLVIFQPIPMHEARGVLGLSPAKRYILFAGDPDNPIKRFELACEAIGPLGAYVDIELLVAAGVEPSRMPLYYNAADILLLTSIREGSPNVVKEALACNLPVVSVKVGDVQERLRGVEGCVVCADDRPETIAAGLREVLSNGRLRTGRQAIQELDLGTTAKKIINVYEQALQSR